MKTLIAFAMLSGVAYGQPNCTNLIYQGAPFTSLVTTGPNAQLIVPLSGTVTLAAALPPNAVNLQVLPTAWDFPQEPGFGGQPGFTNVMDVAYGSLNPTLFTFSTDPNGNITAWSFSVSWDTASDAPAAGLNVASNPAGDQLSYSYWVVAQPPPNPVATIAGSSSGAGTWSCQPPPPVNPLAATVAALQTQVKDLTGEVESLTKYYNLDQATIAADKKTIAADVALIAKLEAELKK